MGIISDLYYGKINPYESDFRNNSEYKALCRKFIRLSEEYTAKLSDKDAARFNELLELNGQLNEIVCLDRYTLGFTHGASLIIESLYGKN